MTYGRCMNGLCVVVRWHVLVLIALNFRHIFLRLLTLTDKTTKRSYSQNTTRPFSQGFPSWHQAASTAKPEPTVETLSISRVLFLVFQIPSLRDVSSQLTVSKSSDQPTGMASFKLQQVWQDAHYEPFLLIWLTLTNDIIASVAVQASSRLAVWNSRAQHRTNFTVDLSSAVILFKKCKRRSAHREHKWITLSLNQWKLGPVDR